MERIGNFFVGAIFGAMNFFEQLRVTKHDAPELIEFKRLQLWSMFASVLLIVECAVSFGIDNFFGGADQPNSPLGFLAQFREPVGAISFVVICFTLIPLIYCVGRMTWLWKKNGA